MIRIIKKESELDREFGHRTELVCTYCEREIKRVEAPFIGMGWPFTEAYLHRECAVSAAAQIVNLFEQLPSDTGIPISQPTVK